MSYPPAIERMTAAELRALRAAKPVRRRNAAPEADLQKNATMYLRRALPRVSGIFWTATLNGVRIPTEAGRRRAKASGLNPGLYDFVFIVVAPTPGLVVGDAYFLELKSKTGRLTREQRELMDALWPAGRGASARTVEQVSAALVAWGLPVRCVL